MTDELRLPAVAARLVAWHNRHLLACRIAASQVHGIGYLALPFVDGGKGGTAAVETRIRKTRVRLGSGAAAPVPGRRIFSTPRLAAVAALAALMVGGPGWWLQRDAPAPGAALAAVATATPASAATLAAAARSAAADTTDRANAAGESAAAGRAAAESATAEPIAARAAATTPAPSAGVAAVPAAGASASARRPSPFRALGPRPGAPAAIRPLISEEDKARARQARADLQRTAAAPPPPGRAASPAPGQPPRRAQEEPRPAAERLAAPSAGPAFALTTRALRTRAEADLVLVAMRSLLRTVSAGVVKVEVLSQGDDWRVVGWPFAHRADADKARALLVSRGMRVEVVGF
jgi:hypothetical protein